MCAGAPPPPSLPHDLCLLLILSVILMCCLSPTIPVSRSFSLSFVRVRSLARALDHPLSSACAPARTLALAHFALALSLTHFLLQSLSLPASLALCSHAAVTQQRDGSAKRVQILLPVPSPTLPNVPFTPPVAPPLLFCCQSHTYTHD